jgi:DNA-binding NarL/FixJ family response regulator
VSEPEGLRIVVAGDAESPLAALLANARIGAIATAPLADALARTARGDADAVLLAPAEAASLAPSRAGSRPAAVGALSIRELDVLRLVATGKANAEIARELVISQKTVKNHVSRILTKLQLENRVQAAVAAVRAGLVP